VEVKLLVDTNRYRDFCDGIIGVVEWFRGAEQILLPFVVVAELRSGFACGTSSLKNEAVFQKFLMRSRVDVLYPDDETTFHYSRLFRQLKVQGTPIPTHDIWIAALTLQYDVMLCTRDKHFDVLPQLPVLR